MNRHTLTRINFGAALLLFAACTQDELPGNGNILPTGKYPLEIASVTMNVTHSQQPWSADAPQTRVSESDDRNSSVWDWDGTEKIGVQLYADGDVATYTLNNDRTLTPDKTLYWKDTKNTTVTAWYPVETEVSLANQKDKLAYVLKGSGTGNYNTSVVLAFKHALAKVRVVFSEESTAGLTNVSVSILAPISCTVNKGNVTASGTIDYIPMHKATYDSKDCYEANVTPNLTLKDNAFQLVVDGKTVKCSTTAVTTEAEQLHVITLTVNEKVTEVNVSDITDTEYTVKGNVHLKGNGQSKDLKLTMEAGAKLTMEDIVLAPNTEGNAITCQGDATITLKGNNKLSGQDAGTEKAYSAILVNSGTLTIKGDDNAKLTATGIGYLGRGAGGAGIGANNGSNIIIEGGNITAKGGTEAAGIGSAGYGKTGGDITINGGIIEARGGSYSAGIGGSNSGPCGDIIITGGNIKAYGGLRSPGIGCGDAGACKDITITGGTIIATKGNEAPASIGACYATTPDGWVTIDWDKANVTEN